MIAVDDLLASFLPALRVDSLTESPTSSSSRSSWPPGPPWAGSKRSSTGLPSNSFVGAARPEADALLDAPAVAAKLGVSVSWVRRQSRGTGQLARIVKNVGGTRRYGAAQLDKVAQQRGDGS